MSKNTAVVPAPGSTINARISRTFALLESWRLILRSDQRGPTPEESKRYLPKRYLFDTGVLRHLRESPVPSIGSLNTLNAAARTTLGALLENQAAIEFARTRDSRYSRLKSISSRSRLIRETWCWSPAAMAGGSARSRIRQAWAGDPP